MRRYRLNWSRMKEPESIMCVIFGFVTGVMLAHTGTNFIVDILVISVVSGITNWWMARYMDKKFSTPDDAQEQTQA